MKYRPEVDGLRALAVLPVILFHAGFKWFSGGFVGVDVFFVLSGYLITGIIIAELDAGSFSIAKFYERRARRILPALFTVIIACIPFAWLWLLPEDRKAFAQSVEAVCLFASNFLFWRQTGYFATAAEFKPLLHTWSLAVEEQFYVLFPLLLMVTWRFGWRRVTTMLVLASLASLGLAQWLQDIRPGAAFFLAPPRAWELLLGSLVALHFHRRPIVRSIRVRHAASLVGIAMLAVAIFLYDKTTPFPGMYALVPVLGTVVLLLYATPDTLVGRLLASKPLVGIGLISYSAYLWHWPIFVFARHRSTSEPGHLLYAVLIAATLLLAYLTWRFIEQPFRQKLRNGRPFVFRLAAAGTVTLLAIGAAANVFIKDERPGIETTGGCIDCYALKGATFRVAVWGDSFADALTPSLARSLQAQGVSLHAFIMQSCPSLLGVVRNEPGRMGPKFAAECENQNEAVARTLRAERYDYVVLTSAYQGYADDRNFDGEPILLDKDRRELHPDQFMSYRLAQTMKAIGMAGSRVLLITPHPEVREFRQARRELYFGHARQAYGDYARATKARSILLAELAGIQFDEIDGRTFLCVGSSCPITDPSGTLLLQDGSHVSALLAKRVAAEIAAMVLKRKFAMPV